MLQWTLGWMHLLPSVWRQPFLNHGQLVSSQSLVRAFAWGPVSVRVPWPHRVTRGVFCLPCLLSDFGSCFTLTSQADANSLLSVCPSCWDAGGGLCLQHTRGCVCHSIPLFLLVCWVCLRVSPTRGAGDHAVEVPGPVECRRSLIGVPFLRRYDENGQGVSISSP